MSGRWLWVVVIAALVATYALLTSGDRDAGTPAAKAPQPGYYLEDAVIVETGPDGKPRVKLAARVIAQNAQDNSINLTDVRVDYTADTQRHWLLTSQRGFVPPDSQRIQFAGHVQIQDIAGENAPRANTERLELDMEKNIAHTDAPVQIAFGPHKLSSLGLWADLKGETLRLESQVNGHFSPK